MQENDAVYEFDTRIRYSEVGHGGCMTLPALINLFQDCSIFHSEAVGYGPARLKREHKAWVLTHWQLVVDRYPTVGESVTVGTWYRQESCALFRQPHKPAVRCGYPSSRVTSR